MADGTEETKTRSLSEMYDHASDMTKEDALKLCSNFIGGSWETLKPADFSFQVLASGFVNRIFICENQGGDNSVPDEPKKVILRLYGGKIVNVDRIWRNGGVMEEVLVFYTVSNLGLGPKLLGVFPGGRLEQYVESRTFSDGDFLNPEMETLFARKLARMHVIKMPFSKQQNDVLDRAEFMLPEWLECGRPGLEAFDAGSEADLKQTLLDWDLSDEFDWLKSLKQKIKTRQVLAHGDMNRCNCLVLENAESDSDKLLLIDYEFANYGPRGFDIGSHFFSRLMDVTKPETFYQSSIDYPTEEEMRHFIRAYKDEIKSIGAYDLDESAAGLDNEDVMLMEAEFWAMCYVLLLHMAMVTESRNKSETGSKRPHALLMMTAFQKTFFKLKNSFIERHLSKT
ncbi:Choline/ethanolamine kinase [Halotydeus destructor]|nr:Choline/ethanolamine kinase [Halotydeus destructor]